MASKTNKCNNKKRWEVWLVTHFEITVYIPFLRKLLFGTGSIACMM